MPYPIKCFFEINDDMVQILLIFTQDSEVEDLFSGASPGSESSLFFSNNPFSLRLFEPVQDDSQHDFTWMTDEANGPIKCIGRPKRTEFVAGCVQLWIPTAEPPGEHRCEN